MGIVMFVHVIVGGFEYELLHNLRVGASGTRRAHVDPH